jgi:hypothetical protein
VGYRSADYTIRQFLWRRPNHNSPAGTVGAAIVFVLEVDALPWIRDIDSLYDFIGYVVLSAPDAFPEEDYLQPEEQMNLERAFEELRNGIGLIEPTMMNDTKRKDMLSLLDESLNSYRAGDDLNGAHRLQDFEALIFKK